MAKLIAYRETGSDKHLRDARGVLVMQWGELDLDMIRRGAGAGDMAEPFEQLVAAARLEVGE